MENPHGSFSLITLAEYHNRRRDKDGERIRVDELLDPDGDLDQSHQNSEFRILQGFATNQSLRHRNLAVTFLANILRTRSDEAFKRNTIDFHIISASLGTTGLRAVGYLREDYNFPAIIDGQAAAWWSTSPIPLDIAKPPGQPPQHVSEGFFTRWPSNHDLHTLIADSLARPE